MTQTLRDFISSREAEIKRQLKTLNDELRELRTAKSAIGGTVAPGADRVSSDRLTHRDMILSVLEERPEGGTFDKIIESVRDAFGVEIPQNSMSSQLSRAKSEGAVTLDKKTKIWRSARQSVKTNEPPEGGSEPGEAATSPDMQSETHQGLPSANFPDPSGQTRHWKLPGKH